MTPAHANEEAAKLLREKIMGCASVDLSEITEGRESTFYINDLVDLIHSEKAKALRKLGEEIKKSSFTHIDLVNLNPDEDWVKVRDIDAAVESMAGKER